MESYNQVQNISLIIQPGDSFFPIVDAIDHARHTIKMTIFRMDDPIVRDALSAAVSRHVKVQALVAKESKGWIKRNKKLAEDLEKMGVEVRSPHSTSTRIKRYHYKFLTIDDAYSLILTFNPTQKNLHYARDFGLLLRDQGITRELNRLFDADWQGREFKPAQTPLVISPDNSREKLIDLLGSARKTIRIMDAKLQDQEALGLLLRKAAAGIDIKVISHAAFYDEVLPNFHARKLARYKLHAKCVVVDGARFFVGSQNLRKMSLDRRRELGIIIEDPVMARRIERVFDEDWTSATEPKSTADKKIK
ncbi:MAG TPA: phospholipase D-like domain-containing protein [Blastocatellia bacterium]